MSELAMLIRALLLIVALVSCQPLHAAQVVPMGFDEARLLLSRTSFAASEREVEDFARLTREQAVDRLLRLSQPGARTPAPAWVNEWDFPRRPGQMSEDERKAFQRSLFERSVELRGWWLTEMLTTPSPLTEKMTLFWHNHFVSSLQKVRAPQLMYRQNVLLRKYALGNFGELLHAVSKDPAMVIYLDSASNRKGAPNENFAREAMELFTLGQGHYGEQDVKEAARAFTGWGVEMASGEFRMRPVLHDDGIKTVLGNSANLDGDAVLDILLARRETAEFIVAKLWREFVSPVPDPAEVRLIAGRFRASGYDIKAVLTALLTSDAFYASNNRATLTKSPVDLVVGTLRQFNFELGELTPFVFALHQLGQDLFAPPNVKGWPGGEAWIDSSTLLARRQLLERLFRADEGRNAMTAMRQGGAEFDKLKGLNRLEPDGRERMLRALADIRFDSSRWLTQFDDTGAVKRLLLPREPAAGAAANAHGLQLIRAIALDPVYQLK